MPCPNCDSNNSRKNRQIGDRQTKVPKFTPEEYFIWEEKQLLRHEYINIVIPIIAEKTDKFAIAKQRFLSSHPKNILSGKKNNCFAMSISMVKFTR